MIMRLKTRNSTFKTMNLDWKQNSKVENSESRLKIQIVDTNRLFLKKA